MQLNSAFWQTLRWCWRRQRSLSNMNKIKLTAEVFLLAAAAGGTCAYFKYWMNFAHISNLTYFFPLLLYAYICIYRFYSKFFFGLLDSKSLPAASVRSPCKASFYQTLLDFTFSFRQTKKKRCIYLCIYMHDESKYWNCL